MPAFLSVVVSFTVIKPIFLLAVNVVSTAQPVPPSVKLILLLDLAKIMGPVKVSPAFLAYKAN